MSFRHATEARCAARTLVERGFTEGMDRTATPFPSGVDEELYPSEPYFEQMILQVAPDFCLDTDIRVGSRRRADVVVHFRLKTNPRGKLQAGCGQTLHYVYLTVKPGWEARLDKDLANAKEIAEALEKTTPKCPICSDVMLQKQLNKQGHPHDGKEFWGCWRYPDCHGMRADWRATDEDPEVGKILKDLKCPECGSPMAVRIARKGAHAGWKFYGCVKYPECKGTLGRADAIAQMLMRDQSGDDLGGSWR